MSADLKKQVRSLLSRAEKQGFRVELNANSHWTVKAPDGVGQRTFAQTPSDWRGVKNMESDLKKMGLDAPSKEHVETNGKSVTEESGDFDTKRCRFHNCDVEFDIPELQSVHEAISHGMEGRRIPYPEQVLYILGAYNDEVSVHRINELVTGRPEAVAPAISRLMKRGDIERTRHATYRLSQIPEPKEEEDSPKPSMTFPVHIDTKIPFPQPEPESAPEDKEKPPKEPEPKTLRPGMMAEVSAISRTSDGDIPKQVIFTDELGTSWVAKPF